MVDRAEGDNERKQGCYVQNPAEGKTLTIGKVQVIVKATGAETDGRFALVEVTVPPYFSDIWPHLHQQTSEAIYLTQGMLAVTLGEETMVVRQGSFILVPPKQVHRLWNPAATPATFLVYFAPAGVEGFFEALARMELPEKADQPSAVAEVWALGMKYDHYPMR
jgi:quercetin dioxygenase-like cupin family protein